MESSRRRDITEDIFSVVNRAAREVEQQHRCWMESEGSGKRGEHLLLYAFQGEKDGRK